MIRAMELNAIESPPRQTDCLTPLIIRFKSSNQFAWLACVYTIPLDCRGGGPLKFESDTDLV